MRSARRSERPYSSRSRFSMPRDSLLTSSSTLIALAALPGSSVLSRVCRIHLGAAPKKNTHIRARRSPLLERVAPPVEPGGKPRSAVPPAAHRRRRASRVGASADAARVRPDHEVPMLPVPPPSRDPKQLIAIVGMAGRFPGAADVDGLWRLLVTRGDAIRPVPAARWGRERPRHPRQRAGGGGRRPGPPRPSDRCAGGRTCRYQRTTPNMPNGTRSIRDPA
jgi:hypothetical protein